MTPNQFKQFKTLIHNIQSLNNVDKDLFKALKEDEEGELKMLFLKEYRQDIVPQILGKYKVLNVDEVDVCYFRAFNSLIKSIAKEKFTYNDKSSVKSYLFTACKYQAIKLIENKKRNILPFSVTEFLLNSTNENDELCEKHEKEKMLESMKQALLELKDDCKTMIQKFYLDEMSHAEIVEEEPQLLNVKNSSAKTNRCLTKLRMRTLRIFKQLEFNKKN